MNPTVKPRADARLKTLPEERQAQIADFARTHSLLQTVHWLGETGLATSISAVSKFLRWHHFRQRLARNEAALRTTLAEVVRRDPTPTGERLHDLGNLCFAASSLEEHDLRAWQSIQAMVLRRAEHQLNCVKVLPVPPPLVPSGTLLHPSPNETHTPSQSAVESTPAPFPSPPNPSEPFRT